MKILCLLSILFTLNNPSYTQEIPGMSCLESPVTTVTKKYDLIKNDYLDSNYRAVIREGAAILSDTLSEPPVYIYRYLACSYYKTDDLRSAYEMMVKYLANQDTSLINDYDIYLAAQFAARNKNKDKTALDILGLAYDKDTTLANKKLYAAAIVTHYLQTGSEYAATAWREKLLPLKELSREEMYSISRAWYAFTSEGNMTEIFGQFASAYPNAFRSLYMHSGINANPENSVEQ